VQHRGHGVRGDGFGDGLGAHGDAGIGDLAGQHDALAQVLDADVLPGQRQGDVVLEALGVDADADVDHFHQPAAGAVD
jgi:hypothetical protein